MELARMGGGGGERKLFLTVSGGADGEEEHVQEVSHFLEQMLLIWNNTDNQVLSQVSLHDYSQIQIVDAVTSQDDDEEVSSLTGVVWLHLFCVCWIVAFVLQKWLIILINL